MESYTRLSDGGRSQENQPAFTPPFSSEYDQRQSTAARLRAWWAEHVRGTPAKQYPVSGYLTLIPLSGKRLKASHCIAKRKLMKGALLLTRVVVVYPDERLRPRRTKLLVGGLVRTSFAVDSHFVYNLPGFKCCESCCTLIQKHQCNLASYGSAA